MGLFEVIEGPFFDKSQFVSQLANIFSQSLQPNVVLLLNNYFGL